MIHPNEILLQKVDFLSKDIANQLYGKSIERVKNRRKLTFVKSYWYLNRLQNLGGFKGFKIISPTLVLAYSTPAKVKLNKGPFKYCVIKRVGGEVNDYFTSESWYTSLAIFDYRLGGVKKGQNFDYVMFEWPLSHFILELPFWKLVK